jgi:uracil-DNA glycosylase
VTIEHDSGGAGPRRCFLAPTAGQGPGSHDGRHPDYLPQLAQDQYLPTEQRLFAAFALPLNKVKYVLVGEGPYPRAESATGVCFMDGAVGSLWSEEVGGGLSKPVNKATSLRNFMKMLLVADGQLLENTAGEAMAAVSAQARSGAGSHILTLADMQRKLTEQGFLLLNARWCSAATLPRQKTPKPCRS